MLQVRVVDSEVGCVHRRSELVAVGAIADEGANETRAICGLKIGRVMLEQSRETCTLRCLNLQMIVVQCHKSMWPSLHRH